METCHNEKNDIVNSTERQHGSQSSAFHFGQMSNSILPSSQDSVHERVNDHEEMFDVGKNVEEEGEVEKLHDEGIIKIDRKKRSVVYQSFTKEKVKEGGILIEKWKCVDCKKTFKVMNCGTTSHLKNHREKYCIMRESGDKKQRTLSFGPPSSESEHLSELALSSSKFDQMRARELIAKWIIVHEHAFSVVEEFWHNALLKYLNPSFRPVSRATITNDCMKIFSNEKGKLKEKFSHVDMIGLTTDTWTSNQTIGYMCLTAHYVDADWKLQKRILNFCELDPPHTGIVIADAILKCLVEWGIDNKIMSITLDNCTTNDVVVRTLKDAFIGRGSMLFKGKLFHVRCSPHILNLMVQDGLLALENAISNIRESVKYIKKSSSRLKKFGDIAKQLNLSTSRGLSMDVPTRWNSTFFMLESALCYKVAFQNYAIRDDSYKWLPSPEEWEKAEKIRPILKQVLEATQIFSGTKFPTANLFLPKIWKVAEILKDNALSHDDFVKEMAIAMKFKFHKYWKDCSLLVSLACLLDPRYKMKSIEFIFDKIYSFIESQEQLMKVKKELSGIYSFYVQRVGRKNDERKNFGEYKGSANATPNEFTSEAELDDYLDNVENEPPEKSDLERYLEEPTLRSRKGDPSFDVIDWWKTNALTFPVLSIMARDILSIPISAVASESAFSTGGRVLTDFRSSLSPKTVEALVCTSDWIRATQNISQSSNQVVNEDDFLRVVIPE